MSDTYNNNKVKFTNTEFEEIIKKRMREVRYSQCDIFRHNGSAAMVVFIKDFNNEDMPSDMQKVKICDMSIAGITQVAIRNCPKYATEKVMNKIIGNMKRAAECAHTDPEKNYPELKKDIDALFDSDEREKDEAVLKIKCDLSDIPEDKRELVRKHLNDAIDSLKSKLED